jgi:hypothetical protein
MRPVRALVVGLAATAAFGLTAPPANAATLLHVTVTCYRFVGSNFDCFADVANGTAPFTYSWTAINGVITSSSTTNSISGTCNGGVVVGFVIVRDSAGLIGAGNGGAGCN